MVTELQPATMKQAELFRLLGRGVAEDAIQAGWIAPRIKRRRLVIYAVEDFRRVERRLLDGEYPREEIS